MNQQSQLTAASIGITLATAAKLSGTYGQEKFGDSNVGKAALSYSSNSGIPVLGDMPHAQQSYTCQDILTSFIRTVKWAKRNIQADFPRWSSDASQFIAYFSL